MPVVTLYGHTGAGKSALLRGLAEIAPGLRGPRPWPLDLEQLALHRGSLLGGLNQPGERRQKDFDALLWDELRRPRGDYLVLEGEGRKIGRIFLPATVADAIRGGIPVLREGLLGRASGADHGGVRPRSLGRRRRRALPPEPGADQPPGCRARPYLSLETAFDDGRFTDVVQGLLVEYYDPLYERSCVEGRHFAFEFETGPDPILDARRFAQNMARLMREVSPKPRDGHR